MAIEGMMPCQLWIMSVTYMIQSTILQGQANLKGATKYWLMVIRLWPYLFQVCCEENSSVYLAELPSVCSCLVLGPTKLCPISAPCINSQ